MGISKKIKLIWVVVLAIPRQFRAPNYFLPIPSRKVHEIESKVESRWGGGRYPAPHGPPSPHESDCLVDILSVIHNTSGAV